MNDSIIYFPYRRLLRGFYRRGRGVGCISSSLSHAKKEKFLGRWLQSLEVPFCMGVGGSFDVAAGVTQRAPKPVQDIGMEWAWRFAQEPQRMWRRYLLGNLRFGRQIVRARLSNFKIL